MSEPPKSAAEAALEVLMPLLHELSWEGSSVNYRVRLALNQKEVAPFYGAFMAKRMETKGHLDSFKDDESPMRASSKQIRVAEKAATKHWPKRYASDGYPHPEWLRVYRETLWQLMELDTMEVGGDGSDGHLKVGGTVTLTRTLNLVTIEFCEGAVLVLDGYRLFVQKPERRYFGGGSRLLGELTQ